ncbi:hypothetical protein Tsubulata_000012, partial [Turnera subulata]
MFTESISGAEGANLTCIEKERQALLRFKQDLIDEYGVLSSWGSEEGKRDCCQWRGVGCDNITGHVTLLDLHSTTLPMDGYFIRMSVKGNISNSIVELQHLTYLDLSENNFEGSSFPNFLGSLSKLRNLSLSGNVFDGTVSEQFGNLSALESLDLSYTSVNFGNYGWLGNLSSLEHLDLSGNNLINASDLLQYQLSTLPRLQSLGLQSIGFNFENLSISHLSSLRQLDLSGNNLIMANETLQSQLANLSRLQSLDLSSVQFDFAYFDKLSHLTSLEILDLSGNDLTSNTKWLQYQLGNLSRLQSLKLSSVGVSFDSLAWLSHLFSLEHLDLSLNDLSNATDWLQVVYKLSSLKELYLMDCSLSHFVAPSLMNASKSLAVVRLYRNNIVDSSILSWLSNFGSSLVHVDLSQNQLYGPIPYSFGNLISLTNLDLSSNQLQGGIPSSFRGIRGLKTLNLGFNNLSGPLPESIQNLNGSTESLESLLLQVNQFYGSLPDVTRFSSLTVLILFSNQLNGSLPKRFSQPSKLSTLNLLGNQLTGSIPDLTMLPSLRYLILGGNQFNGSVSETIGSLSELKTLDLSYNSLPSMMSEFHFLNLSNLKTLDLSRSSVSLKLGSDWIPPFKLRYIRLASCSIGPQFPSWLQTQSTFSELDISNASISDTIPSWLWDLSADLSVLNLSKNQMSGILPDLSLKLPKISGIDLSSNHLKGPLPLFPSSVSSLILFNNMFSGSLSPLCDIVGGSLNVLDLSNNLFSGRLPDCFTNWDSLVVLNLANNSFSGEVPYSMGSMSQLGTLSLHNNNFSGDLPLSLRNCSQLTFLDLSENRFSGEIPAWIGESLSSLIFLSLQSNEFRGNLPPELCRLAFLRIVDLSANNISGIVPKCLNNLTGMVQTGESKNVIDISFTFSVTHNTDGVGVATQQYINKAWLGWKGRKYEYEKNLGLLRIIDFARNNLIGEIPEEMTRLSGLVALNLSGNNLMGAIPKMIGQLRQLQALDLSGNKLSGTIPASMADLSFLSYLNLSYNQLSGEIPPGTQLQSLDASAFVGNFALCGLPLSQDCPHAATPPTKDDRKDMEENPDEFKNSFYPGIGTGFNDNGVLSSWGSEEEKSDCCRWRGIGCDNMTGHVTLLDLHSTSRWIGDSYVMERNLKGKISHSIVALQHLTYLDLGQNDFQGSPFPNFLGSLRKLRHLGLTRNSFAGAVSLQFGNLSSLHSLDLSYVDVQFGDYGWLGHLSSLEQLDLTFCNLRNHSEMLQHQLANLTRLKSLILCSVDFDFEKLGKLSLLYNLEHLDLGQNDLTKAGRGLQYQLSNLSRLQSLDLSFITFNFENFDKFPHLTSLQHLDLNGNDLSWPPNWLQNQLVNFSNLQSLDLSNIYFPFINLAWLSHLSSLEHLDLTGNDLSKATDWLQLVFKLPHLKYLKLPGCNISHFLPPSFINASTSLAALDLSRNNLSSSIFPWISNFSNLADLDLSQNQLQGSMPDVFGNLIFLENLDLSYNQIEGIIPRSFREMHSLKHLYMDFNNLSGSLPDFIQNLNGCTNSLERLQLGRNRLYGSLPDITRFYFLKQLFVFNNQLNGSLPERFSHGSKLSILSLTSNQLTGSIPDLTMLSSLTQLLLGDNRFSGSVSASIGSLSELQRLDLSYNALKGMISEVYFSNLSSLRDLDLSYTSLTVKFASDWVAPFKLDTIRLGGCSLGPHFPEWLGTQNNFRELDISNAGISDTIPDWFWNLSSPLSILNISHNQMSGNLPDLSAKFPILSQIDSSFNQFEGPLPLFPASISSLSLSDNMFSGSASPLCKNWKNLVVLNLANNTFSGEFPTSLGLLSGLETLTLRSNRFSGELLLSLKNCSHLKFLDLTENRFSGEIPAWIGETLSSLIFLSLQSNEFHGEIPLHLCRLTFLQILDLSLNNIAGKIPKCINNITAMAEKRESDSVIGNFYGFTKIENVGIKFYGESYINKAFLGWKGRKYEYKSILGLLRIIDISGNKLIGEIPEEMTGLLELVALNLSRNNLAGEIPAKIGQLHQLQALDLSGNQFSGSIPSSMADLNFLNCLNLSYNRLSGKIPSGTQLQTFNASAFAGNLALCGLPLIDQTCPGENMPQAPSNYLNGDFDEFMRWFYAGVPFGFSVFFIGVAGALLLTHSWRD